jgi:hypothetical protein
MTHSRAKRGFHGTTLNGEKCDVNSEMKLTHSYLANNARVIDSMGAVDHAPNFGVHSTRTYIAMAHLNTWISRAVEQCNGKTNNSSECID